jgi:hypothetical protein
MLATAVQVYDIQIVTDVQPRDGEVELTFHSGLKARFSTDHPYRNLFLLQADGSWRHAMPVGVIVDPNGRVVDLSYAHGVSVAHIKDDEEDSTRVYVGFWGYCAVCYLTRDHPEFERIQATLKAAAASKSRVWFANETDLIEGETEIWSRIMDVRPIEPLETILRARLAAAAEANGAASPVTPAVPQDA